MRRHRRLKRLALGFSLAMALAATASPVGAAVKVGETFTPDGSWGGTGVMIQVGSPGGINVVPEAGVLTSWSFEAAPLEVTPPLKLKVMRHAGGDDFTTVADSELQTPTAGVLNTWPTQLSAKAGDLLALFFTDDTFGYGNPPDPQYVTQEISGSTGSDCCDPPPGTTTPFESPESGQRADVSAMLEPDNSFTIGAIPRNKKKGTATINLALPNPGELTGSGNGAQVASARAVTSKSVGTGPAQLVIKAKGKKKKKLNQKGKVKLTVAITYTPTGGSPNTQSVKVKLKKKL